jgi:hypothetical protein
MYSLAWKKCKQARDIAKNQSLETDVNTLLNSIICLQHLTKGQSILPKLYSELERLQPQHPFITQQTKMEQLFDKAAKNFIS